MEIIYTNGMITINETMIVVVVSFLILVFVLNRLMFRPLLDTIKKRHEHLDELSNEIQSAQKEASELAQQLKDQELEARNEGQRLKKELQEAGSEKAKEILDASRQEITKIRENAQKEVDDQLAAARQNIQQESEVLSRQMMEIILGRSVS